MRILVVENNRQILADVMSHLAELGHEVDQAEDGLTGLHLATTYPYDLIVLDIMLPGMDGLQLYRFLRQDARRDTPVLMLAGRNQNEEALAELDSRISTYLVKPFALSKLSEQIDVLASDVKASQSRYLQISDLVYDLEKLEIARSGKLLKLDPIGQKLLIILMRRSPAVVHRETLERAVWGDMRPESDSLRSHIHKLRQTLDKPFDTPLLHTIRGVGFRLADLNE